MRARSRWGISLLLLAAVSAFLVTRGSYRAAADDEVGEQRTWAAYWTVEPGFTSTLEMKNNRMEEPLTVYPSLYFLNGEEYPLAPVQVAPRQTVVISLNRVMEELPAAVAARAGKEGSLELEFAATNPGALMGSVTVTNPELGMAWNFFLWPQRAVLPIVPVRGLFWFPNGQTDGFVVVQNASEQALTVNPDFHIAGQRHFLSPVSLLPGQSWKLELRKELRQAGLEEESAGGVEFTYQGAPDALKAHGVLFDQHGFSTEVDFTRFDNWPEPRLVTFRTPRFAVGAADPRLGLPAKTSFEPVVALHNFNVHPLDVALAVGYRVGESSRELSIPLSFAPGDTKVLSLHPYLQKVVPADAHWASLEVSYTDRHNGLVAAMVSTSEDGEHSLRSVLNWVQASTREGWYWRVDADHNTLLGILNSDTEEARVQVSLDYTVDGVQHSYELPERTLAPRASDLVDIGAIIAAGEPDADGDRIPAGVTYGGYRLRKVGPRIDANVTTEALLFDRKRKDFLTIYNTGCCYLRDRFSPLSLLGIPGDTGQLTIEGQDACSLVWVNITTSGSFSSGNTGIATVGSGTGLATYVAPGSTTLSSNITFFRDTGLGECALYHDFDHPPVTVNPTVTIDSFSPNPIAQNSSASVLVTVQPSATMTLTITSSGTGRATFGSSGSTTTQISGTTSVSIRGDATSTSGAVDLTLTAKYGNTPLATAGFSVTSGACTAVNTSHTGDGLKSCPAQVQLIDNYNMTNYCSDCQISCSAVSYDNTFTPGSCEATTNGMPGSGNRTLTSFQNGNFTSTDCNFHPVVIRTRITNAQGTVTTDYTGGGFSLKCTYLPDGTRCPG